MARLKLSLMATASFVISVLHLCCAVHGQRRWDGMRYSNGYDDSSKDPDNGYIAIKRLDCSYEEEKRHAVILDREDWVAVSHGKILNTQPRKLVVIRDGGTYCTSKKDCLAKIEMQLNSSLGKGCDHEDNFIIGGDGYVYQGRGWDVSPYWYLKGLRNQSITVQFLGSYETDLPTEEAIDAFRAMIVMGVWLGKLTTDHGIIPIRQVNDDTELIGDSLYENMASWTNWVNESYPRSLWEYRGGNTLKCTLRRNWRALDSKKIFDQTLETKQFVLVSSGGDRCHTQEDCTNQMKSEQNLNIDRYGDLLDNFYIGDDGYIYEGRGWNVVPHWYLENIHRNYISIKFIGSFQTELPSNSAIDAFKSLVNTGISMGWITEEFNLISLGLLYNGSDLLGERLELYMTKWTPWNRSYNSKKGRELYSFVMPPVLDRRELKVENSEQLLYDYDYMTIHHPIKYIMVADGKDSCFTTNECISLMNSERMKHKQRNGDLFGNFYIGCDGIVYEGLGWSILPQIWLKYLNYSYITVEFLCHDQFNQPPHLETIAFERFVKIAIDDGKISPDYKLYSFRHVYNDSYFLGDDINSYMEGRENWSEDVATMDDNEKFELGLLPIISRDDWTTIEPTNEFNPLNYSAEVVIVRQKGDSCFTSENCKSNVESEFRKDIRLFGDIADHYYIGDNGNSYEGRKFTSDPDTKVGTKSPMFITFLGEHNKPSTLARVAFQRLIQFLVDTGRLVNEYKLLSAHLLFNDSYSVGLDDYIMSNEHWTDDVADLNISSTYGRIVIIPRAHPYEQNTGVAPKVEPAEYVIILDGGSQCSNIVDCLSQLHGASDPLKNTIGKDNFRVGDGYVFEDSGWDSRELELLNCTECNYITVRFFGRYFYDLPSKNGTDLLKMLLKWGLALGKLSNNYKIISIRQLCDKSSLLGDALNLSVRKWDLWTNVTKLTADCSILEHRLIKANELDIADYRYLHSRQTYPIMNIIVGQYGEKCFSVPDCSDTMKTVTHLINNDDYGVSFFVGQDGNVYEGLGWDRYFNYNNYHGMTERNPQTIYVIFFGDYNDHLPPQNSISAFNTIIIKGGLKLGKLSDQYIIQPLSNYGLSPGRRLREKLGIL